jgi:hypothetical protein
MVPLKMSSNGERLMKRKLVAIGIFFVLLLVQQIDAQTWGATKRLTWNPGNSQHLTIAVDSNDNIHLAWADETPGNSEIFYRKSTSGGSNWTSTKRLTWNSEPSTAPAVSVDSSNIIHIVYYDNTPGNEEIYYKRSTNGGGSWTTKRLTWNSGHSNDPAIAVEAGNTIHVVWHDFTPGDSEIYYRRSTNGGTSWGGVKRLTWTSAPSYTPDIVVDSSNKIHVVCSDYSPSPPDIFYKRSTDEGGTWGSMKRLTWTSGLSINPKIASDSSNNIHIVWQDYTPGTPDVYYKKSTDEGSTWGSVKRLTWTSAPTYSPAISVDSSDNIHVVYDDDNPGNGEIYHKRSTNGGMSWTSKRISWSPSPSGYSAMAVDSGNAIHLVWQDYTPGNYEVFYRKGIQ